MNNIDNLFKNDLKAINIGAEIFYEDLSAQEVETVQVGWKPPAINNKEMLKSLEKLNSEEVEKANRLAIEKFLEARPMLVDVARAIDVIPGMTPKTILHAGPPITWERMCGPMKGAIIGAILFEGFAKTPEEAAEVAASGEIKFAPCHEHGAVGPMGGIIAPHMSVHVFKNITHGNLSFCPLPEGTGGKVLRYGAYSEEVLTRLRWMQGELRESLHLALSQSEGIDGKALISQALHMGDECHNRNKAGTSLFMRELFPLFLKAKIDYEVLERVLTFINSNDHYFLSLSMPTLKASLDAAHGIKNSTIVTTLCRNGVDFGIRVSGCEGNTWFTGPAQMVKGLLFPGFTEEDANPDMGDSAITETGGVGGFALAAAPAIVQFVGGNVADGLETSKKMYEITYTENQNFSLPNLDFRGGPCGIDVRKVVSTGILPVITTGIAHKEAGVGQVGAGITSPPIECFEKALNELASRI
jgi:hypothetical protein